MRFAFFFGLLVFELAEIEHTAHRGVSGWGYLPQGSISLSGRLESIPHWHNTELLAVFPDNPDLFALYLLVDPVFSDTHYLPKQTVISYNIILGINQTGANGFCHLHPLSFLDCRALCLYDRYYPLLEIGKGLCP